MITLHIGILLQKVSSSFTHEIPIIFKTRVHFRVHNSPPLVSTVVQLNLVPGHSSHFFKTQGNNIIQSRPCFFCQFPHQNLVCSSLPPPLQLPPPPPMRAGHHLIYEVGGNEEELSRDFYKFSMLNFSEIWHRTT